MDFACVLPRNERIVTATLRHSALGNIVLVSIYVHQGVSLRHGSAADELLSSAFFPLRDGGHRIIVGGDFNHSPQQINEWMHRNSLPFVVVSQLAHTFSSTTGRSNIDFFVTSPEVAAVLSTPCLIPFSGFSGHLPVSVEWADSIFDSSVIVWTRSRLVSSEPVFGPPPDPEPSHHIIRSLPQFPFPPIPDGGRYTPIQSPSFKAFTIEFLSQWTSAITPYLSSLYGSDFKQPMGYTFRKTSLRLAIKIADQAIAFPQALRRIARHVFCFANHLQFSDHRSLPPATAQQSKSIYKQLGPQAPGWLHAIAMRLSHDLSLPPPLAPVALRLTAKSIELEASYHLRLQQRHDSQQWHEDMGCAAHEAQPKAFAFVKGAPPCLPCGDIIQFTKDTRNKWASVWQSNEQLSGQQHDSDIIFPANSFSMTPLLVPDQLRAAARAFSTTTTTPEGWHPRHFLHLTDFQLQPLCYIFKAWELMGRFELPDHALLIRMIPKMDGGIRPIGLFPALPRLWGKATQPILQDWVSRYAADHFVNMAKGRPVGDATWRHKALSTLDREQGGTVLETLLDFTKCFEHVRASPLIELAIKLNYPLHLLAISLSSYRWPRIIVMDYNIVSEPVLPNSGIVAGSTHATYELTMFTVLTMRELQTSFPSSRLSQHIDDISLMYHARNAQQAIDGLVSLVQRARLLFSALYLPFSHDKSVTIGSHQPAVRQARRRLGPIAGRTPRQTRSLGLGLTLQRTKAKQVTKARFSKYRGKFRRLRFISNKKKKLPTSILFGASLRQGALWGCEFTDISPGMMRTLRHGALVANHAHIPHASRDILWAVVGAAEDPAYFAALAPLLRYHREWWLATSGHPPADCLTPPQLVAIFNTIDSDRNHSSDARRWTNNPVAMAFRSAHLVGWSFRDAATLIIDNEPVALTLISPAGLQRIYLLSYQRYLDSLATRSLLDWAEEEAPLAHLPPSGGLDDNDLPALFWDGIRSVYRSLKRKKKYIRAHNLLRLITGTLPTSDVLAERFDLSVSCPLCGDIDDSAFHRLRHCPALAYLRREQDIHSSFYTRSPSSLLDYILLATGIHTIPPRLLPQGIPSFVTQPQWDGVTMADIFSEDHGTVYTDASAHFAEFPTLARVGMAAVQIHPDGRLLAAYSHTLDWPYVPSAAEGEQVIAALAAKQLPGTSITTDCAAVVSNIRNIHHASYYKNPAAGHWRVIVRSHPPDVTKTKAHRSYQVALQQHDTTNWHGNQLADEWANFIALRDLPNDWRSSVQQLIDSQRTVIHCLLDTIEQWPPVDYTSLTRLPPEPRLPRAVRPSPSRLQHSIHHVQDGGYSFCSNCLILRPAGAQLTCACRRSLSPHPSHSFRLLYYGGSHFTLACFRCKQWGSIRLNWISSPCCPRPPPGRSSAFRRILRSLHPTFRWPILHIIALNLLLKPAHADLPDHSYLNSCHHFSLSTDPCMLYPPYPAGFFLYCIAGFAGLIFYLAGLAGIMGFIVHYVLRSSHFACSSFRHCTAALSSIAFSLCVMPAAGTPAAYLRNLERAMMKTRTGRYAGDGSGLTLMNYTAAQENDYIPPEIMTSEEEGDGQVPDDNPYTPAQADATQDDHVSPGSSPRGGRSPGSSDEYMGWQWATDQRSTWHDAPTRSSDSDWWSSWQDAHSDWWSSWQDAHDDSWQDAHGDWWNGSWDNGRNSWLDEQWKNDHQWKGEWQEHGRASLTRRDDAQWRGGGRARSRSTRRPPASPFCRAARYHPIGSKPPQPDTPPPTRSQGSASSSAPNQQQVLELLSQSLSAISSILSQQENK